MGQNEWEEYGMTEDAYKFAYDTLQRRYEEERRANLLNAERSSFGTSKDVRNRAHEAASMSYDDFLQGDTYEGLAKRYAERGKMAMDDTIGQVAARTGGIASSYATSAGQQAYGDWMSKLEDAARSLYDSERQEAIDRYTLSKGVLDVKNAEKDRRIEQKTALENDIYAAAYAGEISWPQFSERATALGLSEDEFSSIVNQARLARKDDLYERETENARYKAEDARKQIADIISGTVADENGVYNYNIPQHLIDASGLDPITINAWKIANEQYPIQAPETLDFDSEEIIEQLEGGNINANTLATYEEIHGESYANKILRDKSYLSFSQAIIDKLADVLGAMGNTDEAKALMDGWYGYNGGEIEGVKYTAKPLKERTFTVVEGKNGGYNGLGGINRNAVIRDDAGNEYELNSEFIQTLAEDSFDGDVGEARRWIRDNQEKWGVNTKWFKKE